MSILFPSEVQRSSLKEYNLSDFDLVGYIPRGRSISIYITILMLTAVLAYNFYLRAFDITSAILLMAFLYLSFSSFFKVFAPKRKRFRYAIGKEGLLASESTIFGGEATILFPWNIIEYAQPYDRESIAFSKNIQFVLKKIKDESRPFSYTMYTYGSKADRINILNVISKYCLVKQ